MSQGNIWAAILFVSLPGIIAGTLCGLIVLAIVMAYHPDANVAVGLLASCCASSIVGSIANNLFFNTIIAPKK